MRHDKSLIAAVTGLLALAGCAAGPVDLGAPDRGGSSDGDVSRSVFDVGYERIAEIYVEDVDLGTLTADGLSGLSDIDPQIAARIADGRLQLESAGELVAAFEAPDRDDDDAWAELTVEALTAARLASPEIAAADGDKVYEAVFRGIAADLDAYSRYVSPDQAAQDRAFRDGYGGIGVLLELDRDGSPIIQDVFSGGPAAAAGLRAFDRIVLVDGRDASGWSLETLGDALRGPVNTTVSIAVVGLDGSRRSYRLARARVIPNVVDVRDEGDVVIIRVSRFNAGTLGYVEEALDAALARGRGALAGLILDLRGNPGGLLDQSVAVADLFLGEGEIIHTRGRHPDSRQRFMADRATIAVGVPIVALIDGRSASGAEVVAAALQDSRRAVVIGSSSFGKGSVQTVTRLPNNGELFLTWSRIYAPSGYTLHEQGVFPSICTSAGDRTVDEIVRRFRSGELGTPTSVAGLRARAAGDPAALERLRAACPWRAHDEELDVAVALRVLRDPSLFQQAMAAQSAPALAAR